MTSPAVTPSTEGDVAYFATAFTAPPPIATATAIELVDYFHLAFTPEPVEAPPEVVTTEAEGNTPGIYGVWSYKVRDIANNYVADLGDLFTVTTVDTKNEVGTWTATIPVDAVAAPYLITPGNGIVELLDGEIVFSGPMDDYRLVDDETGRRYEVSGKSDAVHLQDRLAVPNPDDLRTVGGVMPYPPVADSARTGLTGIPDNTNLYNDLKADEFSDTVGVVSQAGQTMSYRGVGSIPTGLLNPFRITGVRVRAIGRCDSGVDNALFAYIRVGGVDYLGLHWISLSGSPSEASGTWLTNPATGLPWTVAQIETLVNSGGFGFKALSASVANGDTGVGLCRLEVLSFAQDEYDNRYNIASTTMTNFVKANADTIAGERRIAHLTFAADPGVGTLDAPIQARYDNLLELCQRIGTTAGLVFMVRQSGTDIVFSVRAPVNHSGTVRFARTFETLAAYDYESSSPKSTHVYEGGAGQGVERSVIEVFDHAAEGSWGRRIEKFADARDTGNVDELLQSGRTELANDRATTALTVAPLDSRQMRYGRDWNLGDIVTVILDDAPVPRPVLRRHSTEPSPRPIASSWPTRSRRSAWNAAPTRRLP
jgi:hypothetical protein